MNNLTPPSLTLKAMAKLERKERTMSTNDLVLSNGVTLKPIPIPPPFNEHYMAGDDGNIYSNRALAGWCRVKIVDWKKIKCQEERNRLIVHLLHKGKRMKKPAHTLVCMAFNGLPGPKKYLIHIDGDIYNGVPSNLKWGTAKEAHAVREMFKNQDK